MDAFSSSPPPSPRPPPPLPPSLPPLPEAQADDWESWDPAPFLRRTASAPGALEFGGVDPPSLRFSIAASALDRFPRALPSAVAAAHAALAGDVAAYALLPSPPIAITAVAAARWEQQQQQQQHVAAGDRGKPPRHTPPPPPPPPPQQQQQHGAPAPSLSLPVLRRADSSRWDKAELRRRNRELEGECRALAAASKQKDGDIEMLTQKVKAEAAERERAQVLAALLGERGKRVDGEYAELQALVGRIQQRARGLRANERRMEAEMARLERLNQEAAAALASSRRLLAASDARIHHLEERRLESEREALQLQAKTIELERALLETTRRSQQEAERKAAAAAEYRPPPTVPETAAPPPPPSAPPSTTEDKGLKRVLRENLRLQEQLRQPRPPPQPQPSAPEPPTTEAPLPSTSRIPLRPPKPPSPSHILGGFPRASKHKPKVSGPAALRPPTAVETKPPHVRIYGFDPTGVRQAIAAARAAARGQHKPLSWSEASAILRTLQQHHPSPQAGTSFSALSALDCLRRNSTIDHPIPVLRAFLRALRWGHA